MTRRNHASALAMVTTTAATMVFYGMAGDARGQSGPPPAPVLIARASLGSVVSTVTATGTVVSRNDARLAAEVSGNLIWVAEPGARVTKGASLARIDTRALELQLREDEAQVRRLAANAELLETQLRRLNALGAGIASRNQIDEAAARVAMARQEHEQALVARDRTRHAISRAVIRAPFPGHVVERIRQLGEYVGPGTEVLRLTDTGNVEVVARAPVANAASLSVGLEVVVRSSAGDAVSSIRAIVPVGDDRSRMLELRIALPDAAWAIGSAVRVELREIALAGRTVVVPRDAVIVRADGAHVYRVGPDDLAEKVAVRLGKGDASRVEVLDGLLAGDRIVVRGGERLTPGQPVRVASSVRSLAST